MLIVSFVGCQLMIIGSIVPSEDAHQSEWVAASDKRREFISGQVHHPLIHFRIMC